MASLTPLDPAQWSARHARHLLNRAGFGIPQPLVLKLAAMTPEQAVDHLLNFEQQPRNLSEPDFLLGPDEYFASREAAKGLSVEERQKQRNETQKRERQAVLQLQQWWLQRMVETPRPLEEKLALFWHGHFATSAQKVKSSYHTYQLNKVFREHAAGNLKTLTTEVGKSFSMLTYLDNFRSTKKHPNENWARELMELFTLGQGQYTEQDIKEAARAFTGWSRTWQGYQFRKAQHDTGEKTFMGQTGNFGGEDILRIIFEQPAAASFVPSKLWAYLAYEDPEPEVVQALTETARATNFELKPLLRVILLSDAFYSEKAVGSQVKSPAQFVVQLTEDLNLEEVPYPALARACDSLGQSLFFPPNVKGWEGNRTWINANTLLLRYNLPPRLAQASMAAERGEMMEAAGEMKAKAGEAGAGEMQMQQMQAAPTPAEAMKGAVQERMRQVQEKLRDVPPQERKRVRQALRKSTPEQRNEILKSLGLEPLPWRQGPLELFDDLEFRDGNGCVRALAARFFVTPLGAQQHDVLLNALGIQDPAAPLELEDIETGNRRAALHLITSMAEYQLC